MKKVKLVILGIIVVLVLVFAFQNQTYFQKKDQLRLELIIMDPLITPEISNAVICLASLFLGFVLSFIMGLSGRVKRKRAVKELNSMLATRENEIATLKSEVEASRPPVPDETTALPPDEPVTQSAA